LGEHGDAGLLEDLGAGEVGGFAGEIGILNTGTCGGDVLGAGCQVGYG
jgi:hypothetical protein